MRAADNGEVRHRLGPRAVRVRNRCVAALAVRRGLQVPTARDLEQFGDEIDLHGAFAGWARMHPAREVDARGLPNRRPPAWWQSAGLARAATVVFAAMLGVLAGTRWLPRARAQASGEINAPAWLSVNDSIVGRLNEQLLALASSDMRLSLKLSAADIAAMLFESRRLRMLPVDSLEARLDSALHVRGRLEDGQSFEFTGDLALARRGVGELRIDQLTVDGIAAAPEQATRVLTRARRRDMTSNLLRFDVPAFVASLRVTGGVVEVTKRER